MLLFGQNYLIFNIINTINLQNIIIVTAFSFNIWKQRFCRGWWAKSHTHVIVEQVSVIRRRSECSTHPHSIVDWLQPQRHYIMSLWLQLKGVGGGTWYISGILAPPPLHEIRMKLLLFPKIDHSFVRWVYRLLIVRLTNPFYCVGIECTIVFE